MSRRDRWIGGGGRRANFPGKAKNLKNLKNWGDEAPGAGGGGSGTTLNPSDRNNITLSSDKLTATGTSAASGVRATTSKSTGKWYFESEFDVGGAATAYLGVMPVDGSLAVAANTAPSKANVMRRDGNFYSAGVYASVFTSQAALNAKICVAVDLDANRIWWRTNAGVWNDGGTDSPATGVGGVAIADVAMFPCFMGTTADGATFNFGATPFSYTIPIGFAGWDASAAADPYFSSVVFLASFDGADGATSFTDLKSHALTTVGNAQIDTAQSKFGGSSALFDGSGDSITSPDHADWNFGNSPFTVECWVRHASGFGTNEAYFGQWGATIPEQSWFLFLNAGSLTFRMQTSGGLANAAAAWTPVVNTWYHLMADRDSSGFVRTYINGVMSAKTAMGATAVQNGTGLFGIGSIPGVPTTYDLQGWIEEIRVTKGVCRCGSDAGFTPPTAAFPRA